MPDPMSDFAIDYAGIVGDARPEEYDDLVEFLAEELPYRHPVTEINR